MRFTILCLFTLSMGCATPAALVVNRTHATPADGEVSASFADADVKHEGVPVFLAKDGGAKADYLNQELQARLGSPTSDATKLQTTMTIEELFVPKPVVVVTLKTHGEHVQAETKKQIALSTSMDETANGVRLAGGIGTAIGTGVMLATTPFIGDLGLVPTLALAGIGLAGSGAGLIALGVDAYALQPKIDEERSQAIDREMAALLDEHAAVVRKSISDASRVGAL
jgi:hypothetical protein